jgi:hypothetical protein
MTFTLYRACASGYTASYDALLLSIENYWEPGCKDPRSNNMCNEDTELRLSSTFIDVVPDTTPDADSAAYI